MRERAKTEGLAAQLRHPPGGRDGRTMLLTLFVDRTGTGVWAAACVLYFTELSRLTATQIGLLLGLSSVAGIAGTPLAGRLAASYGVRPVLIGCHLLRVAALGAVLCCSAFWPLLALVALATLGDRAARAMEMLYATEVAGERRSAYRALSRTAMNAGYAAGAGLAALGLAVGTPAAYRALVVADVASFLVAAALVASLREPFPTRAADGAAADPAPRPSPWRDAGYLRFVALDAVLTIDDAILNVGLPLWLIHSTRAPHALVPAFLVVNTVVVVLAQLRVSALVHSARQAVRVVPVYGFAILGCCAAAALAHRTGAPAASALLLAAAVLVTLAELVRSVVSWELSVALAPERARPEYLGVAGMAHSTEKAAGPLLLTGAVLATGPLGWLTLGAATTAAAYAQRRYGALRLAALTR
ncbi:MULTISPECIES: MFS transporter [Kitasatospora]|uniref:Putative major facilitator superfamily transporter n=1 Tax=Kitasatospora setae (strain ATCC 33774 / DSM 43861 / JCM 3304 / KCC A-0304 / NBRC 14216 / KM-6054) TaxID=452652 RepID=E4N490_KITSK|nr:MULTISPECIES: MFS transporter [Kitasatospora]BAJ26021.1 putative major facilitator superfamily transporter [Kitasatospora setae KM-6054]